MIPHMSIRYKAKRKIAIDNKQKEMENRKPDILSLKYNI
jgi:hypothetical protein